MIRKIAAIACALGASLTAVADQPSIRVQPPALQGSRPLEKQTETAVVRDYLESWKNFSEALNTNQAALLDQDFVGTARDKLGAVVDDQAKAGIHTRYQDRAHDLQIVFYSPEGLSIQLVDNVDYDEQIYDHDKLLATEPIHARYVVILTPTEVRWKVRVFQVAAD